MIVLPWCPESPSYLYQARGREAARAALRRLQPDEGVVNVYLDLIRDEIRAAEDSKKETKTFSTLDLFRSEALRKQLIVGIAVQLMMQFSGIDAVFYYSTTIFYQAEVSDPELATTLLGIINVAVTIVAVKYMDVSGRKRLLTISWVGLLASYAVLTMSFVCKPYYGFMDKVSAALRKRVVTLPEVCMDTDSLVLILPPHRCQSSPRRVRVCALLHVVWHLLFFAPSFAAHLTNMHNISGVIIFFAFGPGCIAWFIIAEIFPLYARDTAMAV